MIKLSVLMSVYNGDKPIFLEEALSSIQAQNRKADSIVLVADGPLNKEIESVICRFEKILKLIFVRLEANIGLGGALNEGLQYCEGDFIARMDSDDICHPERFEKQLAFFEENPEIDVIGSFVREVDLSGNLGKLRKMPVSNEG